MSLSKRRILDEALKLFAINGYEATSIEQITNAVGIRKSSLYSHFKSKKEILELLVDEIKEQYQLYLERMLKDFEMTEDNFKEDTKWDEEYIFKYVKSQFYHIQREPNCKDKALKIVEEHIKHFFTIYSR